MIYGDTILLDYWYFQNIIFITHCTRSPSSLTPPPPPQPYSLLTLANSTCFKDTLSDIQLRFNKLYKRKAHLHHYTRVDGMEMDMFRESSESLRSLITEYETLQATMAQSQRDTPRLNIC